jgi:hypothetical protein
MSSKQTTETITNGERPATAELDSEGNDSGLRRDELFEILGNRRRLYVLVSLKQDENGEIDFSELVTRVAALENDVPVDQVDSDERKSVYVGLRQTHLPKMDEYDLIEYDRDRGRVTPDDATEKAQLYLEYVPADNTAWAHHYLGLSAIVGTIITLSWRDVFPFANLEGMAIAVIAVAVFGTSALAHSIHSRRKRLDSAGGIEELETS